VDIIDRQKVCKVNAECFFVVVKACFYHYAHNTDRLLVNIEEQPNCGDVIPIYSNIVKTQMKLLLETNPLHVKTFITLHVFRHVK